MNLLRVMKNVLGGLRRYLTSEIRRARVAGRYPTCRLCGGVALTTNSRLGRYNVLFERVSLIDSTIDDHTYLQQDTTVVASDLGKYCSVAMQCFIGLPQHEIDLVSSHPVFYLHNTPLAKKYRTSDRSNPIERTAIGHDVWIGHGALVMSGVKIGVGAVIGAGSVVTRDVPSYAIVGGIPARVIRFRFDEALREKLIASTWWEKPEAWIESHAHLFDSPIGLLAAIEQGVNLCQRK